MKSKEFTENQTRFNAYRVLYDGFIDVIKRKKPEFGSKVLVKLIYKSGKIDYNVAIYAICGYDKRKRGFFQNFEHQLQDSSIMDSEAVEYTRNVKSWFPLDLNNDTQIKVI